jgi:hypothetical protein
MPKELASERQTSVERPWLSADCWPCVVEGVNCVTSNLRYQRRCGAVGVLFRWRRPCGEELLEENKRGEMGVRPQITPPPTSLSSLWFATVGFTCCCRT